MARLSLYRRGKIWWIDGSIDGERIRESTRTAVRIEAEQIAAKRERDIHKEKVFGSEAVLTFGTAAGIYLDAGKSERYLKPIFAKWKTRLVKDIKPGNAHDLAREIYPDAAPATMNRQVLAPVQAIINHAAKRGLCSPIRIARFKVPKAQKRVGDMEWLRAFMAQASPHLGALAQFMAMTGSRISDAVALTWDDVNLRDRTAVLRDTKNGDDHVVTLPAPLMVTLANLEHRSGKVFCYKSRQSPQTAWESAERRAKIAHIPPHDAGRRLFATIMIRSGVDHVTVAKAGGWKSPRMVVEVYAQPDDPRRAVDTTFGTSEPIGTKESQPHTKRAVED